MAIGTNISYMAIGTNNYMVYGYWYFYSYDIRLFALLYGIGTIGTIKHMIYGYRYHCALNDQSISNILYVVLFVSLMEKLNLI